MPYLNVKTGLADKSLIELVGMLKRASVDISKASRNGDKRLYDSADTHYSAAKIELAKRHREDLI